MKVAIVGAGNGGQATAAHLSSRGHVVRLYDNDPESLGPLVQRPVIEAIGALRAVAHLDTATLDLGEALDGASVVLVTVPGFALSSVARDLAPYLDEVRLIILHPGGTGGCLEFRQRLVSSGRTALPAIAETDTLLYACRLRSPGLVDVKAVKRRLHVAALPATDTDRVAATLAALLPSVVPAASVLETSLANINPIVHPPIVLTNAARLETAAVGFDFYAAGVSPAVGSLIAALDAERLAVAAAWGVRVGSITEWARDAYGVVASDAAELFPALATTVYAGIGTPGGLFSRYLTEDVPVGLVPLHELAGLVDVPTPVIDAVVRLTSTIVGSDFTTVGRTVTAMGIDGMSAGEIRRFVGGVAAREVEEVALAT